MTGMTTPDGMATPGMIRTIGQTHGGKIHEATLER